MITELPQQWDRPPNYSTIVSLAIKHGHIEQGSLALATIVNKSKGLCRAVVESLKRDVKERPISEEDVVDRIGLFITHDDYCSTKSWGRY